MTLKDKLQKKLGEVLQEFVQDLKIKSFDGLNINISESKLTTPSIKITSPDFNIKVIDKSLEAKGEPISDIPLNIDVEIPSQEIISDNVKQ